MDADGGKLYDHLDHDADYEAEIEIWYIAAEEGVDWPEAVERWKERNLPFTELQQFDWTKEDKDIPF